MQVASPKAIRKRLAEYAIRPVEVTHGDKGAVIGAFENVLEDVKDQHIADINERRYLVWGFCFGDEDKPIEMIKSGDLDDGQIFALKKWVGFSKDELTDEWCTRESFCMEVRQIFTLASFYHWLDCKGEGQLLSDWLAKLEEQVYETEEAGMVQSAVEHMGGVVTYAIEPPEGYVPL